MEKPKDTVETYAPLFMPLLETPKGEIALIELAVKFAEYVFHDSISVPLAVTLGAYMHLALSTECTRPTCAALRREQKDSELYDAPELSTLLHILYLEGLVEEQAILHWHDELASDAVKEQADNLVQWLIDADPA